MSGTRLILGLEVMLLVMADRVGGEKEESSEQTHTSLMQIYESQFVLLRVKI